MRFLYVHLPFCRQKCNYCDFISHPPAAGEIEEYVDLLLKEAELYKDLRPENGLLTVYFGGGNPGLLGAKDFARLLEGFKDIFGFAPSMEISVELNPETAEAKYLGSLRKLGVNRLSLGAQAFQNDLLKAMGRQHSAKEVELAVVAAVKAGFKNINLDLIYGLPHQTMAQWRESLRHAVNLPVTHISTYGLKLHPDTPWGQALQNGDLVLTDDDLNCDMQLFAMDYLAKKKFYRYEIANFAKIDYPCRHNTAYWLRKDYLGLGLGAASLLDNVRLRNLGDMKSYSETIGAGIFPWSVREVLTAKEIREEEIMLALRLVWGLNVREFAEKYGSEYFAEKKGQMVKFFDLGLLTLEEGQLKLTDKGVLLNNEVLVELI